MVKVYLYWTYTCLITGIIIGKFKRDQGTNVGTISVHPIFNLGTADVNTINFIIILLSNIREGRKDNLCIKACRTLDGNIMSYRANSYLVIIQLSILTELS